MHDLTLGLILLIASMVMTLWHAAKGTPPLWVPLLIINIYLLILIIPLK